MTRQEYIEAVKAKLEEISPFDEPSSFIALANNDPDQGKVKPIISYIDKSLDEATHNCLRALPLSLLHKDITLDEDKYISINRKGVGFFAYDTNQRPVRISQSYLERDITTFITSENPMYLLQQNMYTRNKSCKPLAVITSLDSGIIEVYSFPKKYISGTTIDDDIWGETKQCDYEYIDTSKHPDDRSTDSPSYTDTDCVKSPIEEYIILECAAIVAEILGDINTAQILRTRFNEKIQSILK